MAEKHNSVFRYLFLYISIFPKYLLLRHRSRVFTVDTVFAVGAVMTIQVIQMYQIPQQKCLTKEKRIEIKLRIVDSLHYLGKEIVVRFAGSIL
jgi:hypothetical protein